MDRTRLTIVAAACLWLFLTFMYATYLGVLALVGFLPAIALAGWGRNRRVLQAGIGLGIIATLFGIWTFSSTTSNERLELAGFVIVPAATTLYSLIALSCLDRR